MFHHLGTDDIYGDGGSNLQVTGHTVGGRCGNKSGGDFPDFGKWPLWWQVPLTEYYVPVLLEWTSPHPPILELSTCLSFPEKKQQLANDLWIGKLRNTFSLARWAKVALFVHRSIVSSVMLTKNDWLSNLSYLIYSNSLLAHKPWLLNTSIRELS